MEKAVSISIHLQATGKQVSIPIAYTINTEDGIDNLRLINCKVDLPDEEIPEWLSPAIALLNKNVIYILTSLVRLTITIICILYYKDAILFKSHRKYCGTCFPVFNEAKLRGLLYVIICNLSR